MKYFYDTEFLEGTQKRRIGKYELPKIFETKNTIDLISIGIVAEDNREYYAISKDFNLKEAWYRYDLKTEQAYGDMRNIFPNGRKTKVYWIRENVLKPIWDEYVEEYNGRVIRLGLPIPLKRKESFSFNSFRKMLTRHGKTNKQIAKDIYNFVNPDLGYHVTSYNNSELKEGGRLHNHFEKHNVTSDGEYYYAQPEFYSYYGAYDHVALCWLFGKMIDLPKGFPMFAFDIQQQIEEYKIDKEQLLKEVPQINCHNSLEDARWNYQAYKWIQNKLNDNA